ncbi:hypothetical protein [Rhodoblastus sp.]|uniref:hypothetical protein n=1 Tax=Rhodoblastus sp. TaxID=1962975 RepID=UPI003F9DE874
MRFSVLAFSFAFVSSFPANAYEVTAQCSLVVDGNDVWNGKCCVSADASPDSMTADLHAEGWQACLYKKRHPENESLPTYKQKCFGPWINISRNSEKDAKGNDYSAYWSLEGACHGGENYSAKRSGNTYQGDKFIFEWHEVQ